MHTNSLLYSRELGSRAGKFEYMSEMVAANQIQMKGRKQAYSDLMTGNAGSTELSRTCSRLRNTFGALIWQESCAIY